MDTILHPIVSTADATGAETGVPGGSSGVECLGRRATEAYWYLGLPVPLTGTVTVQPWLYNPTSSSWHMVGAPQTLTGNQLFLVYVNGEGGRTFLQVTAASAFPVSRDIQFMDKGA